MVPYSLPMKFILLSFNDNVIPSIDYSKSNTVSGKPLDRLSPLTDFEL